MARKPKARQGKSATPAGERAKARPTEASALPPAPAAVPRLQLLAALVVMLALAVGAWLALCRSAGIAVDEPWVQLYDPSRHSEVLGRTPGVKRHLFVFAASAAQGHRIAPRLAEAARGHFRRNDGVWKHQYLLVDAADRTNRHVLEDFGLSSTDLPAMRMLDLSSGFADFAPAANVTLDAAGMARFSADFHAGKLKRRIRSTHAIDDSAHDVKSIVGSTFEQRVLRSKQHVLLAFVAPWCGHCQALEPEYERVGAAFAQDSGVLVAKIDGAANDVDHPQVVVKGFPALYFFPRDGGERADGGGGGGGEQRIRQYGGAHTAASITAWLREQMATAAVAPVAAAAPAVPGEVQAKAPADAGKFEQVHDEAPRDPLWHQRLLDSGDASRLVSSTEGFEAFVQQNSPVLVSFIHPASAACERLAPAYGVAAAMLLRPPLNRGYPVVIGRVDVSDDANTALLNRFGIAQQQSALPDLRIFFHDRATGQIDTSSWISGAEAAVLDAVTMYQAVRRRTGAPYDILGAATDVRTFEANNAECEFLVLGVMRFQRVGYVRKDEYSAEMRHWNDAMARMAPRACYGVSEDVAIARHYGLSIPSVRVERRAAGAEPLVRTLTGDQLAHAGTMTAFLDPAVMAAMRADGASAMREVAAEGRVHVYGAAAHGAIFGGRMKISLLVFADESATARWQQLRGSLASVAAAAEHGARQQHVMVPASAESGMLGDFGLSSTDLPAMRMLDLSGGFADFAPIADVTLDAAGMARFSADFHAAHTEAVGAGADGASLVKTYSAAAHGSMFNRSAGSTSHHLIVFAAEDDAAGWARLRAALAETAATQQTRQQHVMVAAANSQILGDFGLCSADLPAMRMLDLSRGFADFAGDHALDAAGMARFSADFHAGKLKRRIRSTHAIDDSAHDVKSIVGSTFEQRVLRSKQHVLLAFVAPWCGHCQALEPEYERVGAAFAQDSGVLVAKIDGAANDVDHPQVVVKGFPALYFFPRDGGERDDGGGGGGGEQRIRQYGGAHTAASITAWLREQMAN